MAEKRIYEITLEAAKDSILCSNPIITFEKPDCPDIKCDYKDGKIVVEYPDDCPLECIYAIVDCSDECAFCEPERVEICPCVTAADCPDCHDCIDNLCVTRCKEDETCVDGRCVECEENADCPCNQICVNGDCQCPANKPNENPDGCCSECATDEDCPDCGICTSSGCQAKDCGGFEVDPDTCECVECVNNSHCDTNECCVEGDCECCQGYRRNAEGNCVLIPECEREEDCPECYTCVNGTCVPTVCPPGFICINDNCVPECDCDDPNCPGVQNCVEYTLGTCYCNPCFGNCDENSDCGDGCYCDNGECKPNPCYDLCADGAQCGEGCGCVDGVCYPCSSIPCDNNCSQADGCHCIDGENCEESPCKGSCVNGGDCGEGCGCFRGQCVPCSEIDCNNCLNVLGCECVDGINCVDSPCNDQCIDGSDCDFGCGCLDNRCVSCEAVDCTLNGDCPEGCYCDGGTCKADPCYKPCSTPADCDSGCDCEGGICVNCSSCDDKNRDCNDTARLFKDDANCDLVFEYTSDYCCECPDISLGAKIVGFSGGRGNRVNVNIEAKLRKGAASTYGAFEDYPLLSETGIDNELPETGRVRFTIFQFFQGRTTEQRKEIDFSGKDREVITFTDIVAQGASNTGLLATIITMEVVRDISFPNNCRYDRRKEYFYRSASEQLGVGTRVAFELSKLEKCRTPLLTWYKSDEPEGLQDPDNIFRQFYAIGNGQVGYTDRLVDYNESISTGDYRLETCKYYRVQTDCGCSPGAVYSCDIATNRNPKKLTFCKPDDFDISVDQCTGKVIFESNVIINCDVLQHEKTRPIFQVLAGNAVIVEYALPRNSRVLIPAGTELTIPMNTTSISIRPKCDECGCIITKNLDQLDPLMVTLQNPVTYCPSTTNVQFVTTITGGLPPYTYTLRNGADTISTPGAVSNTGLVTVNYDISTASSSNYTLEVTDALGCVISDSINYNYTPNDNFIEFVEGCNEDEGLNTLSVINNTNRKFILSIEGPDDLPLGVLESLPFPGNSVINFNGASASSMVTGSTFNRTSPYILEGFKVKAESSAINCSKSITLEGVCGPDISSETGSVEYECNFTFIRGFFENFGQSDVYVNMVNEDANPNVTVETGWKIAAPGEEVFISADRPTDDVDDSYRIVTTTSSVYTNNNSAAEWTRSFAASGDISGTCNDDEPRGGGEGFDMKSNCTEVNGDCTGCTVTLTYDGDYQSGSTTFDIKYMDGNRNIINTFSTNNPNGFVLESNADISNGRITEVTTEITNSGTPYTAGPFVSTLNCSEGPEDCSGLFASFECEASDSRATFYINNFNQGRSFCASINGEPVVCSDRSLLEISTNVRNLNSLYELTFGYTDDFTLDGLNNNSVCKKTLTGTCVFDSSDPPDGSGTGNECTSNECFFRIGRVMPQVHTATIVLADGTTSAETVVVNSTSELPEFYDEYMPDFIKRKSGADTIRTEVCGENDIKYIIVNPNKDVTILGITVEDDINPPAVQRVDYTCQAGSGTSTSGSCEADSCLAIPIPGVGVNPSSTIVNVVITEADSNDEYQEVFSLSSATEVNDFWNRLLPQWIESVLPGSDASSLRSDCPSVSGAVNRKVVIDNPPTELSSIIFEIEGVDQTSFFNC